MKKVLIHIILFCTAITVRARQNAVFYSLTEKDGLTDNHVNCFFQDSRGIMWMGTNYGLNSYDGSAITTYHAADNENALPDDAINDIKEDQQHNVWIATGNGLACYNITQQKIYRYFLNKSSAQQNRFYCLEIDQGRLLLGSENGLVAFDIAGKKFTTIINPAPVYGCNRINRIFFDSHQRCWLGTFYGLWRFTPADSRFESYDNPANDNLFDGLITDIYEDHTGQLWFGTWNKGMKKINPTTKTIETFLHYTNSSTNLLSITEFKNKEGLTELCTNNNLTRLNTINHSFDPLVRKDAENSPKFTVTHLYTDRANLLWIATEKGVMIYNPARQYFQNTQLSSFVPLTSQGIALLPLSGKFLLGGEGSSSLLLFSDAVRQLKNLSGMANNGAAVMSISRGPKNSFWLCTSNGLVQLDSGFNRSKTWTHSDNDPNSLPKNFLNNILFRSGGEIWLMPWRKGIWKLDMATNRFSPVLTRKGDTLLSNANISKAIDDSDGKIWITDYTGGLYHYQPATGILENPVPETRLTNEYIAGDKLWTVSSTHIFSVDIHTGHKEIIALPAGKNKYEYDFIPDNIGNLWIATKTGLLVFNILTKSFQQFTSADGLYTDILDISFARLSNGDILMAGGTFAITFSPAIVKQQDSPAPLLFTGAASNGTRKQVADNKISFSWGEKNIELHWALLNYSNPLGNQYFYKLDGVNNDWQPAGNKGQVTFNSLDAGNYIFHYKASTPDGRMSEEETITLIIHPPFWKTIWFRIAVLLVSGMLFYRIVRYISQRNLKEKLLRLEKEQAIEKERNRISRDMHDELGSGLTKIAILTDVIKAQSENQQENIDKISTTARSLVDNLDEMVWALNPKNDSLDKLAAYISEYAHQFLDNTHISCTVEMPEEIKPLPVSEEKRRNIFMVVKEFLNNTVKHSGASAVQITLTQQDRGFGLLLQDNGKGFAMDAANTTGNGLKNMQQRISDAGGIAELHSKRGTGTSLHIRFS